MCLADIHRAFSVLGCDLFGLKPVASPVPHRAQQVRCPAVSGGGEVGRIPREKRTLESRGAADPEG